MQFYGIFSYIRISSLVDIRMIRQILTSTRLLVRMHEKNTIKLYVQVFLRMNTWLFATCQKT